MGIGGGTSVVVHEAKISVDMTRYTNECGFNFDAAFDERCSNADVYAGSARQLVQHVFAGGWATCFAYGQTGVMRAAMEMFLLTSHRAAKHTR